MMRPTAAYLCLVCFLWGGDAHHLLDATGTLLKTFHDPLPSEANTVLRLLNVDLQPYLA